MAYNFKSIADVEAVAEPTESANVLIEENGMIKKAPKAAVGGGAGGGCDAMLIFENLDYNEYGTFATGNYQTLYDKINSLQEVKVLVGTKQVQGFEAKTICHPVIYSLYEDSISIVIQTGPISPQFCISINNDDSVQVDAPAPT